MILRFDKDLRKQEMLASGPELAELMGMDRDEEGRRVYTHPREQTAYVASLIDPVLITDYYRICQFPAVLRDTLYALYSYRERTTDYAGTVVDFVEGQYSGVWGPSIDTLLFCRAFSTSDLTAVRTAIEIGSGSGFIAKHLLRALPALEEITLVDINPNAIDCGRSQINDPRARFANGDGIAYLEDRKFDLIVCNPPYIPRPKSIEDNPYEGIGLLVHLVAGCAKHLTSHGRVITNVSSLCEDIVAEAMLWSHSQSRLLDQMRVPLKVFNVLNNPVWMDYLLSGKRLKPETADGYDYWHTISIIEVG